MPGIRGPAEGVYVCPVCQRSVSVKKSHRLYRHKRALDSSEVCEGSNTKIYLVKEELDEDIPKR